jgi:hypothetical protein
MILSRRILSRRILPRRILSRRILSRRILPRRVDRLIYHNNFSSSGNYPCLIIPGTRMPGSKREGIENVTSITS